MEGTYALNFTVVFSDADETGCVSIDGERYPAKLMFVLFKQALGKSCVGKD